MKTRTYIIVSLTAMFLSGTLVTAVDAQTLNQNVLVEKPYDPSVSDAFKINLLPDITDTSKITTQFSYQLFPKQIPVTFNVEPIQPAKMAGEALPKLYSTYLRAGYGNFNTMLGEAGINIMRSKNGSGGFYVKHLSSIDKIKLDNGVKSPASWSDNEARLFGSRIFEQGELYGDFTFFRKVNHFYGFLPIYDSVPDKKAIFQRTVDIGGAAGYRTTNPDSSLYHYDISGGFRYFEDFYKSYQNMVDVNAVVYKYYNDELIGVNADIKWFNRNSLTDTINDAIVHLNPWVKLNSNNWKLQCGLSMDVDAYSDSTFYHYYPNIQVQYNVIDNFLIPFAGFDGRMMASDFRTIYSENPFVKPGIIVKNTNNKMNLYFGMRGNFSQRLSFVVRAVYGRYKDMHFFINDTTGIAGFAGNCFNVIYDDVQKLTFEGEVSYKKSEKLNVFLRGVYNKYSMEHLDYAWHKPEYEVTLGSRYNLKNKIVVTMDVYSSGNRMALSVVPSEGAVKLKNVIDVNLGVEYRYSKILSGFVNLNNIAASKYQVWNYYPVQRFQILGGITYSF